MASPDSVPTATAKSGAAPSKAFGACRVLRQHRSPLSIGLLLLSCTVSCKRSPQPPPPNVIARDPVQAAYSPEFLAGTENASGKRAKASEREVRIPSGSRTPKEYVVTLDTSKQCLGIDVPQDTTPSGSDDAAVSAAAVSSNAAVLPDAAATAPAQKPYAGVMTFRALLADLIDQSKGGVPTAKALIERYTARAKASMKAGPDLNHPKWASTITGADDIFLDLDGELSGLQLYEDGRGWGAYAVLAVAKGTLAEAEAVVGKTSFVPRKPDDFHSGRTVAAYVTRGDKMVRVFIELSRANETLVHRVTIHFERH